MIHDLLVRSVLADGSAGPVDLAVQDGAISAITPAGGPATARTVLEGGGMLALPTFVDAHVHLEKAFLLARMPRDATDIGDAIAMTAELKRGFTPDDIRRRARRVLDAALQYGTTTLRCHVEVDDTLGLMAIETILELREEYSPRMTIQIVAFPQEGVFVQARTTELLAEALTLGADVLGGIPYNDRDASEHLDFVFDLAESRGVPIDLHLDFSDDPMQLDVLAVIERTVSRGLQNRVTVGHLTSLGAIQPERAQQIAAGLAAAHIAVTVLPATDLFLNGRSTPTPTRGMTPVRVLVNEGVTVSLATNNIQNPFTPFGRGNLLDIGRLFQNTAHFGSADDASAVIDMMSTNPARALDIDRHGLSVGSRADINLFPATTRREVLLDCERPAHVIAAGVVLTDTSEGLHP